MHREVYALLYNDNKDAPPLMQTDTGSGYKQVKARLGMKNVRKWEWTPFKNPARTDGAIFHHWRRVADDQKEYPFAKFNKQLNIVSYTINEYNTHLRTNQSKWSKAQTDHLFDLAKRFDLRFVVMADRWDRANHGTKTVEDLKERYYEVVGLLAKVRLAKLVDFFVHYYLRRSANNTSIESISGEGKWREKDFRFRCRTREETQGANEKIVGPHPKGYRRRANAIE